MKQKGSITVFAALSMMLIVAFLLALFEAARVYAIETYVDMTSKLTLESLCAEYQSDVWENYALLCLDGAYGRENFSVERIEGRLKDRADRNLEGNDLQGNLFAAKLANVDVTNYQLLTDANGDVFLCLAATCMENKMPLKTLEKLYELYTQGETLEQTKVEESIENAQSAIIKAQEKQKQETSETSETMEEEVKEDVNAASIENPLEVAMSLKQNTIFEMVLGDTDKLSVKKVENPNSLQERSCQKGTMQQYKEAGWYEKMLALEYLEEYYGNFCKPSDTRVLSYEMEYVLCGRKTDRDNLEGTIEQLMLLREAANVTHILSDSQKRNEAEALAVALAGATVNPAIVKVVQIGIVAAWAYMESIQDVRALLQQNKIALLKNKEQWTLQTTNLLESFQSTSKAKNCENGLSYQSYIKMILLGSQKKKLAYRMMEIIEQNISAKPQQENCRMDSMICQIACSMNYKAQLTIWPKKNIYQERKVSFSYY